jgi:Zn-dependent peptidase ImmA (M78 family)
MATAPAHPRDEAERVLSAFWADRRLPVDPVAIARAMGLDVKQAELPPEISGALVKRAGADAVILLAQEDNPNRKRFTCAHELGHFVRHAGDASIERLDFRGTLASTGLDKEEVFANQFAANLLMPEAELRAAIQHQPSVWQLAHQFGVSGEAMGYRLENLLGIPVERIQTSR